jgi:hypothetical protein
MWNARLLGFALSKELANPRFCFWGFAGSVVPLFPRPCLRSAQRREESAFGLLHALGSFGVAASFCDAL